MCLNLKDPELKVSFEDIEVYKVVRKNSYGCLFTPYRDKIVKLGCLYASILNVYNDTVTDGLHSFVNIEDVKIECQLWLEAYKNHDNSYSDRFEIVKCIIPKGTTYYVGTFNINNDGGTRIKVCDSIASSSIKYLEIVE